MNDIPTKRLADNFCTFRLVGDERHLEECVNSPNFDPNFFNEFEEPIIHTLIYMADDTKNDTENLLMAIKYLMSHPDFNINAEDKFGETAIMVCARRKKLIDVSRLLLSDLNIDLYTKSTTGLSLIELADKYDNQELIKLIENREKEGSNTPGMPHLRRSLSVS